MKINLLSKLVVLMLLITVGYSSDIPCNSVCKNTLYNQCSNAKLEDIQSIYGKNISQHVINQKDIINICSINKYYTTISNISFASEIKYTLRYMLNHNLHFDAELLINHLIIHMENPYIKYNNDDIRFVISKYGKLYFKDNPYKE